METRETEMDEAEFEEILDDWFIESLKLYGDLHVYQLEFPTRVIEWTSAKTVCVASCDAVKQNHILELGLPAKLFAPNKGVCAERDFRVLRGGFSPGPVSVLKHVPETRLIVTNDGRAPDLLVWNLGDDDGGGDVIARVASVAASAESRGGVAMATRRAEVLHGRRVSDVQLTRLETGQCLYKLASSGQELVSSFHFTSDAVFLVACGNGDVLTVDTRASTPPSRDPAPDFPGCSGAWRTDVRESRLLRVSTCGRAAVSDPRNPAATVACQALLAVGEPPGDPEDVCASWAPGLDDVVAVSGFNGLVQIYDTSNWGLDPRAVQPLFQHRGHSACSPHTLARHLWHPQKSRTLASAANDASLHLWDWTPMPERT